MNKPLQLIYKNVAYKMWFVNFMTIDCDIKFIIKTLLQYYYLRRVIQPPPMSKINQIDTWCSHYIDDQGIVFNLHCVLNNFPGHYDIQTCIDYHNGKIIKITYVYHSYHVHICYLTVDFNISDCNPDYIKIKDNDIIYTY